MFKKLVAIYEGKRELGEVEVTSGGGEGNGVVWKEIRINQYSQGSERCPPLAVLHTITGNGNSWCLLRMEAKFSQSPESPLSLLHSTCLNQNKTAMMSLGDQELHLVAMHSRKYEGNFPCFWGFTVETGLYHACLSMLNLRCLGIVFDLDETLIVANTMRSFEDRIEVLRRKINVETDPHRVTCMLEEIKRYQDDQLILKQYVENDQVVIDGKMIKSQSEVVPAINENHPPIIRPIIRLLEKNIVLTRINPQICDTSVLVRLRPAWEDLKSYLTARGRKRFEVYVCTMAERDYALEMWRLLDPDSNLINPKEMCDRISCVKPGSRKSLFRVFQDRNCHPKMALVVDDRMKVWEERDQPRVHVVPAFAPYYAPQAEAEDTVPVLCLARNIACNVRGGFFKEFDEGLLPQISEVAYEDDIKEIPSPDVSNYLVSEDDLSAANGNKETLNFDGMADAEVERRLKEAVSATSTVSLTVNNVDPRTATALPFSIPLSSRITPPALQEPVVPFPDQQLIPATSVPKPSLTQISPYDATILQSSPATEEGEISESELDPDTRRRLLILQHGQDTRDLAPSEHQFPARSPPIHVPVPRVPSCGLFPGEEKMSTVKLSRVTPPKEFPSNAELKHFEKRHPHHTPFGSKVESYVASDRRLLESQKMSKEPDSQDDRLRLNQSVTTRQSFPADEVSLVRSPCDSRDDDYEPGQADPYVDTPAGALRDIALKCGTKVELKPALVSSTELQFVIEVLFAGEKIGEGLGRTRRDAHRQAIEGSLMNLAVKYLSYVKPDSGSTPGVWSSSTGSSDEVFLNDANSCGYMKDVTSFPTQSDAPTVLDPRFEATKRPMSPIAALNELCITAGLALAFQTQPQLPAYPGQRTEVLAQVEIDGQVLGKGIGSSWGDAKSQAASRALGTLKSILGHFPHKRQPSPRSFQGMSNKRLKPDYTRVLQQMPASARFPKNASPVQCKPV